MADSGTNACSFDNGGCSHLCLPVPSGRRCICLDDNATDCMPGIVESPNSVVAQQSSRVTFRCKLKPVDDIGVTYLSVMWLFNGTIMKTVYSADLVNDTTYLTLPSVNGSHAGNYMCNVTNKYGSVVSQSMMLTLTSRKLSNMRDQFILVSDSDVIRGIDLVSTPASTVDLFDIPVMGRVAAFDYDVSSQTIFWCQGTNGTMLRAGFSSKMDPVTLQLSGVHALAVDWIGQHVYYVQSNPGRISLSSMDSSYSLVVIQEGIPQVDTLVVDPLSGYVSL